MRHIREAIADVLHRFGIDERQPFGSPLIRRYRFDCECGVAGPWRRSPDDAKEDGFAHQERQSA